MKQQFNSKNNSNSDQLYLKFEDKRDQSYIMSLSNYKTFINHLYEIVLCINDYKRSMYYLKQIFHEDSIFFISKLAKYKRRCSADACLLTPHELNSIIDRLDTIIKKDGKHMNKRSTKFLNQMYAKWKSLKDFQYVISD